MHGRTRMMLLLVPITLLSSSLAEAATFRVDVTGTATSQPLDEHDANPGDGQCRSTPSGVCTLRAAIEEANALPGADQIDVPAGDHYLRDPITVTEAVTINGAGGWSPCNDCGRGTSTIAMGLGSPPAPFELNAAGKIELESLTFNLGERFILVTGNGTTRLSHCRVEGGFSTGSTVAFGYYAIVNAPNGAPGTNTMVIEGSDVTGPTINEDAGEMTVLSSTMGTLLWALDGHVHAKNSTFNDVWVGSYEFNVPTAAMDINNVTTTGSADVFAGARLDMSNSIVLSTCQGLTGTYISHGYNAFRCQQFATGTGDITNFPSISAFGGLGPLANNGGPTQTAAFHLPSAFLGHGNPALPGSGPYTCETTDQRGVSRLVGDVCDFGAYQMIGYGGTGGPLTTADGFVQLTIPPGALPGPTALAIVNNGTSGFQLGNTSTNLVTIATVTPSQTLAQPATLTFRWQDPNASNNDTIVGPTGNIQETKLQIWHNQQSIAGLCGSSPACNRTANSWSVPVSSFSEFALGGCSPMTKTHVSFAKLDVSVGRGTFALQGTVMLPAPISPTLDPAANGLRVAVEDSAGGSLIDAVLPAGAYDPTSKIGWKTTHTPGKWVFNRPYPEPATGITRATVQDLSAKQPGAVRVVVRGKNGDYAMTSSLPVSARIYFSDSGQCGTASFLGQPTEKPTCKRRTKSLTCR